MSIRILHTLLSRKVYNNHILRSRSPTFAKKYIKTRPICDAAYNFEKRTFGEKSHFHNAQLHTTGMELTNRNIPVLLSDFTMFDKEFRKLREHFDEQMRRMEEEMHKFTSELKQHESALPMTFGDSTNTRPPLLSWLHEFKSPLIQQCGDSKHLKLQFDVSQYSPDEVVVKTVGNKLMIHAKHEEKTDNKTVYREYKREFLLPTGTKAESIKSSLSKDGVLTVEAPIPPALESGEKIIPINKQK